MSAVGVDMKQIIISLSTIPTRFSLVGETLQCLLGQSIKADKIELWIPRSYRRFPDHVFCIPDVPDGITVKVSEEDLGPATKVLPCAKNYRTAWGGGRRLLSIAMMINSIAEIG